jgi:C4-dicarboxylate-specific signal transduction histidine kinase
LDSGEFGGYLVLAKDLTQKRKSEKEVEQQRASMATSSKLASLGEMAAGVAHEINNPLSIILTKASKLIQIVSNIEDSNKEKIITDLEKMIANSTRIAKIVKGLRAFARSADTDPFEIVSIQNIVEDALTFCTARFKNHNVNLIVDNIPNVLLNCRATQISQVILSLLNNSFDAIQNVEDKWIKLEVKQRTDNKVNIIVTDSGAGIPKEVADKIMQPFFTTKDIGKGTGLGLSISIGIIHEHAGTLMLDEDSKFTRFTITLKTVENEIKS